MSDYDRGFMDINFKCLHSATSRGLLFVCYISGQLICPYDPYFYQVATIIHWPLNHVGILLLYYLQYKAT